MKGRNEDVLIGAENPEGRISSSALRAKLMIYWFTRSSIMVPLSSFTLFFSEVTIDPCVVPVDAGASVRFEIPTTPCVCAVIGGRVFFAAFESLGTSLAPVDGVEA